MEATLATLAASVSQFGTLLGAGPGLGPEALGPAGWLAAGAASGVLGITDILGDDDDDDDDDADDGGDDVLDGGDDLGDLGDLDGEGLGEFDDEGDGLEGGGGGGVNELENRLEDLENEVASLSSSVNTVQNENEAMNETVEDVEDNVRDLLEIYEMVTRGVNPFVDETASGAMGGGDVAGGDGFGLFDDAEDEGGDVDDSVADADAEDFFDDDFDEPDGDEFADPDDTAVLDDGLDDSADGEDEGEEDGDGTTFDELKEEYESGDAEWDESLEDEDGGDEDELLDEDGDGLLDEESEEEGLDGDADDEPLEDAIGEDEAGDEDAAVVPADVDEEPADDLEGDDSTSGGADAGDGEFDFVGEADPEDDGDGTDDSRLQEFPQGYAANLAVLEWVEYLIDVGGKSGARDALAYYADVGWISSDVEAELHTVLNGIDVSDPDGDPPDPGSLAQFDPEHHRRSLTYVARLAGGSNGDRATVLDRVGAGAGLDRASASPQAGNPVADGGESGTDDGNGGDGDGL